jgi:hypothetical protein
VCPIIEKKKKVAKKVKEHPDVAEVLVTMAALKLSEESQGCHEEALKLSTSYSQEKVDSIIWKIAVIHEQVLQKHDTSQITPVQWTNDPQVQDEHRRNAQQQRERRTNCLAELLEAQQAEYLCCRPTETLAKGITSTIIKIGYNEHLIQEEGVSLKSSLEMAKKWGMFVDSEKKYAARLSASDTECASDDRDVWGNLTDLWWDL